MFRLTYKDPYKVERVQEYEDYEALMLSLSGCVTLPDTTLITSLTHNGVEIYQGLLGDLYRFLKSYHEKKLRFFLVFFRYCCYFHKLYIK